MKRIQFAVVLALFVIVVIVGLQNNDPVELKFLFWGATVNRLLLFPGLFAFGVIMGVILRLSIRKPAALTKKVSRSSKD